MSTTPKAAPGVRDVLTSLWTTLIALLNGTTKYAQAFEATGDVVKEQVESFRDEERLKTEHKNTLLSQQLAELSKD